LKRAVAVIILCNHTCTPNARTIHERQPAVRLSQGSFKPGVNRSLAVSMIRDPASSLSNVLAQYHPSIAGTMQILRLRRVHLRCPFLDFNSLFKATMTSLATFGATITFQFHAMALFGSARDMQHLALSYISLQHQAKWFPIPDLACVQLRQFGVWLLWSICSYYSAIPN
jgi:hypothetical protein